MPRRTPSPDSSQSIPEMVDELTRKEIATWNKDGKLTPHGRQMAKLPCRALSAAFLLTVLLAGCSTPPRGGTAKPEGMPLVILDTDIGSSTDDLFALEMLFRYEEAGKCRLLGVVVDRPGEANAAFADAMNAWAGRPDLPVGLVRNGADGAQVFIDYAGVADARDGDGHLLFPRAAPRPEGRPDGWPLYRKLLAGAPDGSVTICSIGFLTCLAQLLESPPDDLSPLDGVELVRRKVKRAVVMGGAFADAAEPEYNFVRKQNGGTKHFDGTIALNIHILSSPSYFARDCFDKLFA